MTECERIISNGILTEDFFKEEIRCDFLVDQKRKKIWAVLLDLLREFDRVCKTNNIRYFIGGGTLLGAARHKGFIPWDDDIDVNVLREDYERLTKTLCDEFKFPYFLQTPYTDNGYYFSFAKLKNSNTSQIVDKFAYCKFNQGIGIDIFPYDNILPEKAEEDMGKIKCLILDNSTYMRMSIPNPCDEDKKRIANHSGRNPMDVYEEIQTLAQQYSNENTGYIGNAVCSVFKCEKNIYKKEIFDDIVYLDFELFKLPAPVGYENYLKIHYGNWNKLPRMENRGTWHNGELTDPDVPYKKNLKNI